MLGVAGPEVGAAPHEREAPRQLTDVSRPDVLVVEGQDDRHVVEKLLAKHAYSKSFEILPKGGFPELRKSIRLEIDVSGRRTVGIIADANLNLADRWASIRAALAQANCSGIPEAPDTAGTIISGPRAIRVGIWLMPDNARPGELEDFIAVLIPPVDPLWQVAKQYIDEIPAKLRKFADSKRTRAQVHAWLATREAPRPMGSAITAGDLDHNAPAARSLIEWLRELFSLQTFSNPHSGFAQDP